MKNENMADNTGDRKKDADSRKSPALKKVLPQKQVETTVPEEKQRRKDQSTLTSSEIDTCAPQKDKKDPFTKTQASTSVSLQSSEQLNRRTLLIILAVLLAVMVPMFRMFFVPFILAASFSTLFYPLYAIILKKTGHKRGLAAILTCLTLVTGLVVPTYLLVHMVTLQGMELYTNLEPRLKLIMQKSDDLYLPYLEKFSVLKALKINNIDWQSVISEVVKTGGKLGTIVINKTSTGVLGLVANIGVMLFTMFYFFMDGERIVSRLRYLSPLRSDYEDMLFSRFLLISRATVKGTLLIGLVQGALGGLTLMIFGIKTWLVWGCVMVILSVIPLVGAWIVMIPAGIILIIIGDLWQGIGIIVVSTVIISNVDNLLRPSLVGRDAKMHDLFIFFATLGGISMFGLMGFIIGPVIVALFTTVLDIYGLEFKENLEHPYTNAQ